MKRLASGDEGKNPLDCACKTHDIAYYQSQNTDDRYLADTQLQAEAMKRMLSKDASLGERATAASVALAMKAKRVATKTARALRVMRMKKTKNMIKRKLMKRNKNRKLSLGNRNKIFRAAVRRSKAACRAASKAAKQSSKRGYRRMKRDRIIITPADI